MVGSVQLLFFGQPFAFRAGLLLQRILHRLDHAVGRFLGLAGLADFVAAELFRGLLLAAGERRVGRRSSFGRLRRISLCGVTRCRQRVGFAPQRLGGGLRIARLLPQFGRLPPQLVGLRAAGHGFLLNLALQIGGLLFLRGRFRFLGRCLRLLLAELAIDFAEQLAGSVG